MWPADAGATGLFVLVVRGGWSISALLSNASAVPHGWACAVQNRVRGVSGGNGSCAAWKKITTEHTEDTEKGGEGRADRNFDAGVTR